MSCAPRASSATAWTRRVGPFRVEVLEGAAAGALRPRADRALDRLRPHLEGRDPGVPRAAAVHPQVRPGAVRHPALRPDRLLVGHARGRGESFAVTPDRWWGTRDRSWGVRPVGEAEPPGIRQGEGQMGGMWNYSPMQFDDYSILYIVNEADDGERVLEEAVRIWNDPAREPRAARPARVRARARARVAR